jgi:hypothetical protein
MKRRLELDCDHVPRCVDASRHVSVSETDKILETLAAMIMRPIEELK